MFNSALLVSFFVDLLSMNNFLVDLLQVHLLPLLSFYRRVVWLVKGPVERVCRDEDFKLRLLLLFFQVVIYSGGSFDI